MEERLGSLATVSFLFSVIGRYVYIVSLAVSPRYCALCVASLPFPPLPFLVLSFRAKYYTVYGALLMLSVSLFSILFFVLSLSLFLLFS